LLLLQPARKEDRGAAATVRIIAARCSSTAWRQQTQQVLITRACCRRYLIEPPNDPDDPKKQYRYGSARKQLRQHSKLWQQLQRLLPACCAAPIIKTTVFGLSMHLCMHARQLPILQADDQQWCFALGEQQQQCLSSTLMLHMAVASVCVSAAQHLP
jgi:hypothetical protein